MKCPKCGKEIAKDSLFCEYCGTQVKKNRKPLFITIAIVACLLIFGCIGLTYYNKGEQEQARIERELLMSKREAAEAEAKAKAEHEARLQAEARLERELAEKAKYNCHKYVDLGLSVKWATCNVGASKPEDYGNYYAWGETTTKTSYNESNSVTYWQQISDFSGNATYDVARVNWGGSWRLPTKREMEELQNKCTWSWTTQSGVNGYRVTGPNGNSIFLPAAGVCFGSSRYIVGEFGYYWSSTPLECGTYNAYYLFFNSGSHGVDWVSRYYGRTVRPVSD